MFIDAKSTTLKPLFDRIQSPLFAVERSKLKPSDYTMICVNEAYTEATGLTDEQATNTSLTDILNTKDAAEVSKRCDRCLQSEAPYEYFEAVTLTGQLFAWRTRLQPLRTPEGVVGVLGNCYPIDTKTKPSEDHVGNIRYWTAQAQLKTAHLVTLSHHLTDPGIGQQDRVAIETLIDHLQSALQHALEEIERAATKARDTLGPTND